MGLSHPSSFRLRRRVVSDNERYKGKEGTKERVEVGQKTFGFGKLARKADSLYAVFCALFYANQIACANPPPPSKKKSATRFFWWETV